ncbi:MAG TPA: aldo/keto reductase [Candidatus Baltobacteraceae bacterium]|nr:aldo/keto reductase [Candidatus Baltobacteraceae bacterium]
MEYRHLGKTSLSISRIGFGCGPASGYDYGPVDEAEWRAAVSLAFDRGVNFFDVADVYGFGRAEEMLAEALGEKRREVVIASKCGLAWDSAGRVRRDLSRANVLRAVEESLRRLRLDSIPLYQIHWPDPAIPIEEVMETLGRCQDQGKIRHIGVGNFSLELLSRAYAIRAFDSQQVAFNLLSREPEREIFPWCDSVFVSNIAHSGLARGFLAGRELAGLPFHASDTRRRSPYFSASGSAEKARLVNAIRKTSAETGKPLPSIAIRWILDHPQVTSVLIGIKTRRQAEENLEAIGWRFTTQTHHMLSRLSSACPSGLAGKPAHAGA